MMAIFLMEMDVTLNDSKRKDGSVTLAIQAIVIKQKGLG